MYIAIVVAAIIAGITQTVTGFGGAIVLMLVFPYFFNMVVAPALASVITLGLSLTLAWKFRKHIRISTCLLPTILYVLLSVFGISLAKKVHLEYLSRAFGFFLIALSIYFLRFSEKISIPANQTAAVACAAFSGLTSGLFGIGGPLMAAYFISAIDDKDAYIGSIQFLFSFTNIVNLFVRIANGTLTVNLLPLVFLGILGITIGKVVGLRILNKVNPGKIKKIVYVFVGVSGLLSLL